MERKLLWSFLIAGIVGVIYALIYVWVVGVTAAIAAPAFLRPFFAAQTTWALFLWDLLVVRLLASLAAAIPCALILTRLLRRRQVLFAWIAVVPLLSYFHGYLLLLPLTDWYLNTWAENPWYFLPGLINMGWLPLLVYILNRSTTSNIPLDAPQLGR